MEQIGWQIIVRCRDNRVFAPPGNARLLYIDAVLTQGSSHGLYTHGLGDTHGHLATIGSRKQAGELARRLLITLNQTLPGAPQFEPARILPIENQRHLGHLVAYCLGQDKHHELGMDPLREATAAFDYLGLRPRGDYLREQLRAHLPRITDREIRAHLPTPLVEAFDLAYLREAMHSSVASAQDSHEPGWVAICIAAVHASTGRETEEVAAALGISRRRVERYRAREPKPELVRAIRLQMGLRVEFSRAAPRLRRIEQSPIDRSPSDFPAPSSGFPAPSPAVAARFSSFDEFLMAEFDQTTASA